MRTDHIFVILYVFHCCFVDEAGIPMQSRGPTIYFVIRSCIGTKVGVMRVKLV